MSLRKYIISRDDSIYEAWPDIVLTESGKLICVFAECNHHHDRNNSRIVIRESDDRGITWSDKKYLTEKTPAQTRFNCPRISKLNDGRLVILCDRGNSDEKQNSVIYAWYGDSEGKKWDEPIIYPFCGIVPDKLLQLENGRIIISAHYLNKETNLLEQYLWYSDDDGKNWSNRVTVAADSRYNLCEISIVPFNNHTLVGFLRENSLNGCDMLKTISYDNGETWSELIETPMDCGHRPVCGLLQDGRVMITYRYMCPPMNNIFAAFLNKATLLKTNRSEHYPRIMPLDYDRNKEPDLGYSGWVQFPDGEIFVAYYIKDDSKTGQIRGITFTVDDVILPDEE